MKTAFRRPAVVVPVLVTLAACGGEGRAPGAIRVDTLPNGVVAVHNPEQGLWTEETAWRVVEDLRIGEMDSDGPAMFGQLAALEVDAYGRIYVLESQTKEVRVFDADGGHVRTLGREGAGPGELRQPAGLGMGPGGTLWVVDPGNGRYSVWDTAGAFRTTVPRREGMHMYPWPGRIDRAGTIWDLAMGSRGVEGGSELLRVDPATGEGKRLPLPPFVGEMFRLGDEGRRMTVTVPYTPGLAWTVDPDGRVWSGISNRYRLALHEPGGDTLRVVEREAPPVPVTRAERDSILPMFKWFTDQGGRIDLSRVPEHKPAFESLRTDDRGWLWVRPSRPAGQPRTVLDVFDPEGRYHGRVTLPVEANALLIRGDRIYATVRGEDDVPQVVRMRIEGRRPAA